MSLSRWFDRCIACTFLRPRYSVDWFDGIWIPEAEYRWISSAAADMAARAAGPRAVRHWRVLDRESWLVRMRLSRTASLRGPVVPGDEWWGATCCTADRAGPAEGWR